MAIFPRPPPPRIPLMALYPKMVVMAVVAFMDAVRKVSKNKYDKSQQNINGED